MVDMNTNRNILMAEQSADFSKRHVIAKRPTEPEATSSNGGDGPPDSSKPCTSPLGDKQLTGAHPYDYAIAKAVQSVAQTTAIAIQDAADMMRNVSTEETVAIGAATAKWIADPANTNYTKIINHSVETIQDAAKAFREIGDATAHVLAQLNVAASSSITGKGESSPQTDSNAEREDTDV